MQDAGQTQEKGSREFRTISQRGRRTGGRQEEVVKYDHVTDTAQMIRMPRESDRHG
jgi:hypothetical protein